MNSYWLLKIEKNFQNKIEKENHLKSTLRKQSNKHQLKFTANITEAGQKFLLACQRQLFRLISKLVSQARMADYFFKYMNFFCYKLFHSAWIDFLLQQLVDLLF